MQTLERLCRLLLDLERTSAGTAGALDIYLPGEAQAVGQVIAEAQRICWASVRFGSIHLADEMAREAGIPEHDLQEILEECKASEKSVGEHLVHLGLLRVEQMRSLLKRQTVSALIALTRMMSEQAAFPGTFSEIRAHSYNPMFTFSACEIMAAAAQSDLICQLEIGELPPIFVRNAAKVPAAICMREIESHDLGAMPICASSAECLLLEPALSLYRASIQLARPPVLAAVEIVPFAVLAHCNGQGWLASYSAPFLSLFQVEEPTQHARLLSFLLDELQSLKPARPVEEGHDL